MKIAFINPPFLEKFSRSQRSPAVTKSGTLYFPMWLAYAAGYAEQEGNEIDLIDASGSGLDTASVFARIDAFSPQLAVIDTSTPSIYNDVQFCEELKKRNTDLYTVLVGTHVTALPEESLKLSEAVDAIVIGEYDMTVSKLAACLAEKGDVTTVAGLAVRNNGQITVTEKRDYFGDLDSLPMVSSLYKRFLNIEDYFNPNALYPMVTITTSRGCPFHCIFCVYPQTIVGHRLRLRSVENVVDEIEYIVNNFPSVKAIFFEDDTFPANKKRCIAICEEIIRRKITLSWTANARVDVDDETLAIMKKAGCRCLCVGFESGSQDLLDNIKKKITIDQSKEFMKNAQKHGIIVHGCFIVGFPGETKETMEQTLQLALDLKPDAVQFYPVMVYPGTEAYSWYDERGLISTKDFSKWLTPKGQHNTVIRGEHISSEELVAFCDRARRKFYLRPSYILYKLVQMAKSPKEIKRTVKSARTFFYHLIWGTDIEQKRC